jgi:hypothetical protein
MEDVENIK